MKLPVFRFDDVSVNTDLEKLAALVDVIHKYRATSTILLAISPIVFAGVGERVHPPKLTAMSALDPYYEGIKCGLPIVFSEKIQLASHGLAHVDHRLLGRRAQEMSILMSCSLVRSSIFVPPYNHWDKKTVQICQKHSIELVKWEDGWLHTLHNPFDILHARYYCHPYDMTPEQLDEWFKR